MPQLLQNRQTKGKDKEEEKGTGNQMYFQRCVYVISYPFVYDSMTHPSTWVNTGDETSPNRELKEKQLHLLLDYQDLPTGVFWTPLTSKRLFIDTSVFRS